jgi:hypothetical protein
LSQTATNPFVFGTAALSGGRDGKRPAALPKTVDQLALAEGSGQAQKVEVRSGDFVIFRTGQMERCRKEKNWGDYAGGDAPD